MKRGLSASSISASRSLLMALFQTALEVDERVRRPKLFLEFFPRHDLAGTLQQHIQNLKRLLLQLDFAALPAQFAGLKINLEDPKPNWP